MSTSHVELDPRAITARTTDEVLEVGLADGRTVTIPLAWFPRLLHATPDQRAQVEIHGDGEYLHWPSIDEDLSVEGLLRPSDSARRRPTDEA